MDSDQHSFQILVCHISVPKFSRQNNESVSKISIDLLSELIVLVPKIDKCSSDEIK